MNIQLLCTFCKRTDLDETIELIKNHYEVFSDRIFVLENLDDNKQLILTYNVKNMKKDDILPSTISVHRKKQTNTIYTINALNELIMLENNGVLDKKYKIDWNQYRDCIIVTAFGKIKRINTDISKILEL